MGLSMPHDVRDCTEIPARRGQCLLLSHCVRRFL